MRFQTAPGPCRVTVGGDREYPISRLVVPERSTDVQAAQLLREADEARRAGHIGRAIELLDTALGAVRDPRLRATVAHLRSVVETWRGDPLAAHVLLVAEAATIETVDPGKAAAMLADAAWLCFLAGEIERGIGAAQRASELSRGGSVEQLATVLLAEGLCLRGEGRRGSELLASCKPLPAVGASPTGDARLLQAAAHLEIWLEDYADARALLDVLVEAARSEGSHGALSYALALRSDLDFRTGNWDAAAVHAAEAQRVALAYRHASGLAFSLAAGARVEAARGREEDCRTHAGQALELAAYGVRAASIFASSSLGLLELGRGCAGAAVGHLEHVARGLAGQGIAEPGLVQWAPDLVEALFRTGRTDQARAALESFEEQAQTAGRTWALAAASRCRGLLAAEGDFEQDFADALAWHARTPTPFERARTELCLGERLRRARRRSEARAPLRAALETFERLGAAPWAERARSELAASGETARRRDSSDAEQLTPQELQVARVVAQGATNKEAGALLFLSPKTIETHLGRIYRKLNVRSRTELAHLLAREQPSYA